MGVYVCPSIVEIMLINPARSQNSMIGLLAASEMSLTLIRQYSYSLRPFVEIHGD